MAKVQTGSWVLACRPGAERDVVDELVLLGARRRPQVVSPGLVVSEPLPTPLSETELTFVRQAFVTLWLGTANELSMGIPAVIERVGRASAAVVQIWVPDSESGNRRTALAGALASALTDALGAALPRLSLVPDENLAQREDAWLLQGCLADDDRLFLGADPARKAYSLALGGRTRTHVKGPLPSRSARKLEEALAWMSIAPGPGERCVDLGAAPGGWTYVLSSRRAQVVAVDPGALRPDIRDRRNVTHVPQNAFQYVPAEPVDWLFCDMAYRPLEVAALLARWGRQRWARLLVANIKLPMKKKAEIVWRVKQVLTADGAWHNVRVRQLYHDRDEVTVTANRG